MLLSLLKKTKTIFNIIFNQSLIIVKEGNQKDEEKPNKREDEIVNQ